MSAASKACPALTTAVRFNGKSILSFLRLGEKTHKLQACFTSCWHALLQAYFSSCWHALLAADMLYYLRLGEKTNKVMTGSSDVSIRLHTSSYIWKTRARSLREKVKERGQVEPELLTCVTSCWHALLAWTHAHARRRSRGRTPWFTNIQVSNVADRPHGICWCTSAAVKECKRNNVLFKCSHSSYYVEVFLRKD